MNAPPLIAADDPSPGRAWALAVLIAAAFFAGVAPTLGWLEYSNGNENIVVQTALEMRHGGPRLLPRLDGDPRVKKPPLTTWVTAAAMRPATVAALGDPKLRDAAYHDLAFQTRVPALVAACVMTLATFEFARLWAGGAAGLYAAMAVCTNYLFLKYIRQSTTDAHLAAWVAVANACFAHGLLRGRWWAAATLGGAATGLAFMCKGPVSLVETVLPTMVAALAFRSSPPPREGGGGGRSPGGESRNPTLGPPTLPSPSRGKGNIRLVARSVVGFTIFALIAVPWFWYVWRTVPGVATTWQTEVSRDGATTLDVSNPVVYLELGLLTTPWVVFGGLGLWLLWQRRREGAAWLPVIYAVVPLLVMVWFRDRKERYMLPMIGPAAVVCGYGVAAWVHGRHGRRTRADAVVGVVHGSLVLAMGVALFFVGAAVMKHVDGGPWFPRAMAAWGVVAAVAFVALVAVAQRRRPWAVPAGTFVVMVGLLAAYLYGYRDGVNGRAALKPMADTIVAEAPGAAVYDWLPRGRVDEELALYLNRSILRADPDTLRPIDRPIVVILRQAPRDATPSLPEPWRLLTSVKEGAAIWFAYVRYPER